MVRHKEREAQLRATLVAYDELAPIYNTLIPVRLQERDINDFYARVQRGGILLDSGCATGERDIPLVMEHGFSYVGMDLSRPMLEVGESRLDERFKNKVVFVRADVRTIPFSDESFDGFLAFSLFQHIYREDTEDVLREHFRVLRPGGVGTISLVLGSGTTMQGSEHTSKTVLIVRWSKERFLSLVRRVDFEIVYAKTYFDKASIVVRRPI